MMGTGASISMIIVLSETETLEAYAFQSRETERTEIFNSMIFMQECEAVQFGDEVPCAGQKIPPCTLATSKHCKQLRFYFLPDLIMHYRDKSSKLSVSMTRSS